MKLIAQQPFKWAHQNVNVVEYAEGDVIDTDDEDLIRVSTDEGWTAEEGKEKPAKRGKAAAE